MRKPRAVDSKPRALKLGAGKIRWQRESLAPACLLGTRKTRQILQREVKSKWEKPSESQVSGPDVLKHVEKQVEIIRENLKVAQSWQKSYADKKRRDLAFKVSDFVYLKISPMRGLHCFKVKGKLALRYIGPFKVHDRRGEVAYQLELPPHLADVHDVFHVSQLKKCLRVPEERLPIKELGLWEDLTYTERLMVTQET
jgi:hypothetical protein